MRAILNLSYPPILARCKYTKGYYCTIIGGESCPNCDDQGYIVSYWGNPMSIEPCEFCYTVPNSRFHIMQVLDNYGSDD